MLITLAFLPDLSDILLPFSILFSYSSWIRSGKIIENLFFRGYSDFLLWATLLSFHSGLVSLFPVVLDCLHCIIFLSNFSIFNPMFFIVLKSWGMHLYSKDIFKLGVKWLTLVLSVWDFLNAFGYKRWLFSNNECTVKYRALIPSSPCMSKYFKSSTGSLFLKLKPFCHSWGFLTLLS